MRRTLNVDLDERTWRFERLAVAPPGLTVEGFIAVLLDHVQQGVHWPGSWEREWLAQVLGAEAIEEAHEADEGTASA